MKKRIKKSYIIIGAVAIVVISVLLVMPTILNVVKYNKAVKWMESGEYQKAIDAFRELEVYKDSKVKREELVLQTQNEKLKNLKNVKVGDKFTLGMYELDGIDENGLEEVEWSVLDIQDGKALIFCDNLVTYRSFDENTDYVSWEGSSIRSWLSGNFRESVFHESQLEYIKTTRNSNKGGWIIDQVLEKSRSKFSEKSTQDEVFLLSVDEYIKYESKIDKSMVIYDKKGERSEANGITWWSRSSGEDKGICACGYLMSKVEEDEANSMHAVRPAVWIEIK